MLTSQEIFEQVDSLGIPYASHCSDLYIPKNEQTEKIINAYEFKQNVTAFCAQDDKKTWYDIPFSFAPYFDHRQERFQRKDRYKRYILSCITSNPSEMGYDVPAFDITININKQKIVFFFETFYSEMRWNVDRIGEKKALESYLQGLPSTIDTPWKNYDILELAKKMGSIPKDAKPYQEDKILNNYFAFIANYLLQLKKQYK